MGVHTQPLYEQRGSQVTIQPGQVYQNRAGRLRLDARGVGETGAAK